MTMILLIDNYDSFTYNLVQRLGELDPSLELEVYRNDKITVEEIDARRPSHLIVSPGPCTPDEAGHLGRVRSAFCQAGFRYWAYALGTSRSARRLGRRSSAPAG